MRFISTVALQLRFISIPHGRKKRATDARENSIILDAFVEHLDILMLHLIDQDYFTLSLPKIRTYLFDRQEFTIHCSPLYEFPNQPSLPFRHHQNEE